MAKQLPHSSVGGKEGGREAGSRHSRHHHLAKQTDADGPQKCGSSPDCTDTS